MIDGSDANINAGERAIEISFGVSVDPSQPIGSENYVYVPAGETVTVTYTGEDGTVTETTVDHGDNGNHRKPYQWWSPSIQG